MQHFWPQARPYSEYNRCDSISAVNNSVSVRKTISNRVNDDFFVEGRGRQQICIIIDSPPSPERTVNQDARKYDLTAKTKQTEY